MNIVSVVMRRTNDDCPALLFFLPSPAVLAALYHGGEVLAAFGLSAPPDAYQRKDL